MYKPLLPSPENKEISLDQRLNIMTLIWRYLTSIHGVHGVAVADSNLKLLCQCPRQSFLHVLFVSGFKFFTTFWC